MQSVFQEKSKTLFISLIALSPFGLFLFRDLDPWHGMGMYIQLAILILFSLSIKNRPLGFLTLWLGLSTAFLWKLAFINSNQYAIKVFLPFFNFLCYVILYKFIQTNVDRDTITKLFKWLSYSLIGLLFYCVLQVLNLDQFFHSLDSRFPDELVGTIGNQSHLGGLLAIIQPLLFSNKFALVLLWIILLMTKSASGIIVGVAVLLFYFFHKKKSYFFSGLSVSILLLTISLWKFGSFFNSSGRFEIWQRAYEYFTKRPITGLGLGVFGLLQLENNGVVSKWRHLHMEYYQFMIEIGIIGLLLIIWCIYDYFRIFTTFKTDLTIKIASIFFGFCMLSFFTFPAHLWGISIFGILSYSFIYAIKNERSKCSEELKSA